ncbi:cryptochrome DASH [Leptolyngbya sp. 'hensonii']|uniref:DASH family cryptochrome n=1 Tax=Leptolyngbya sp. 'hensonii' TaxID=1922337 RepID=UPI00095017A3|nr:DASH family cryptochrome [Leptolyngbya sp. 'hensonii']OLP18870.1 cryptochrome DASH [Leptolyngbya sp. 'hensonii']
MINLVWYRNDLRLQDHEPMTQALQQATQIIPVYCFDPRQFSTTAFGFPKTGAFRAQFLLESVADLRQSLCQLGSNLLVYKGWPEAIIPGLVRALNVDAVYFQGEVTSEELAVEAALETALSVLKVKVYRFWGMTLYHPDDLPFKIATTPELFTKFRQLVENRTIVRNEIPTPPRLPGLPDVAFGDLPSLQELGLERPDMDARAGLHFQGGATAGLARLNHYIWTGNCLQVYKETRNRMLGADYSSKFSPWLALGCLSPRMIYTQIKDYETQCIQNDSTYWLIFELLWRDFFRLMGAKHGHKIFRRSGLRGIKIPWCEDWKCFRLWQTGKTGFPLVDANMRELAATGFMSNRGRQNVASFLTKNLGLNWQMGAEWFESLLIDYDVCSNWGNWNYTTGIGNDARGFRYFNIPKQSRDYDPEGAYLRHWLPELAAIPGHSVHEPWRLSVEDQKRYGVRLGVDYPRPIVDFFESIRVHEKIYQAAIKSTEDHPLQ